MTRFLYFQGGPAMQQQIPADVFQTTIDGLDRERHLSSSVCGRQGRRRRPRRQQRQNYQTFAAGFRLFPAVVAQPTDAGRPDVCQESGTGERPDSNKADPQPDS